jgi:hypothetical protein
VIESDFPGSAALLGDGDPDVGRRTLTEYFCGRQTGAVRRTLVTRGSVVSGAWSFNAGTHPTNKPTSTDTTW